MSVHKKLMHARIMMMKAKLEKTGKNSFAGYKYFELGDFLPAVQLIFEDLGLCGIVSYDNEYASLCITDTDDGTTVRITSPMATAQLKGAHDIQNLGAVETYQRRYLWMTAMELVENDPIDSSPPVEKPVVKVPKLEILPTEPEKPKYKVENPKPTVPKESKEFPGLKEIGVAEPMVEWQIKIAGDDDPVAWKDMVMHSTKMTIELTKTPEDVQSIYRVNKAVYERLKTEFPVEFTELLDLFKARKEALK